MPSQNERSQGGPSLIRADGSLVVPRLERVILRSSDNKKEAWLQDFIRANPRILPVEEVDAVFGPPISVGREVAIASGSIDNLLLSPSGYLTIVETKLWRNPQALREVVAQIMDYAKEISGWSFDDLDGIVRGYNRKYERCDDGVLATLSKRGGRPIEGLDESSLVDTVGRNLREGRFMLLVVGDGIRENVERMVDDFLSKAPLLRFTWALMELQLFRTVIGQEELHLVIPRRVARTKEIPRTVITVKTEGVGGSIRCDVAAAQTEHAGGRSAARFNLTAEAFFEALEKRATPAEVNFARNVFADFDGKDDYAVEMKQANLAVKLPDPSGGSVNVSIFQIDTSGRLSIGSMPGQLKRLRISEETAHDYGRNLARLLGTSYSEKTTFLRPSPKLRDVEPHYEEFVSLVRRTVSKIKEESVERTR